MKYDKILFDLDNTILDFNKAEKSAYETASKIFNVEYMKTRALPLIFGKRTSVCAKEAL